MLDIDWLSDNACQWHFDNKTVTIKGRTVRSLSRRSKANIRRIHVEETVVLPPYTQVNVPVHLTWNSLKAPLVDWLAEPKQFKKGLYSARTLLPAEQEYTAINFVNTSPYRHCIRAGQVVCEAVPAVSRGTVSTESDQTRLNDASSGSADYLKSVYDALPVEFTKH